MQELLEKNHVNLVILSTQLGHFGYLPLDEEP
jgi:hypothetical protein